MEQIPRIPPRIKMIDMDKYSRQPSKASVDPLQIPNKFKISCILRCDWILDLKDHVIARINRNN